MGPWEKELKIKALIDDFAGKNTDNTVWGDVKNQIGVLIDEYNGVKPIDCSVKDSNTGDWVKDVKNIMNDCIGEFNDVNLRVKIKDKIIEVLNKHMICAEVDCSARYNTPDVVNNNDFHAAVIMPGVKFIFYVMKKEKKNK